MRKARSCLWLTSVAAPLRRKKALQRLNGRARAGLKDELRTAYWFLRQAKPSPWVSAQAARAARSVQQLESARVVPLRLPAAASAALAGGLVSLALV